MRRAFLGESALTFGGLVEGLVVVISSEKFMTHRIQLGTNSMLNPMP